MASTSEGDPGRSPDIVNVSQAAAWDGDMGEQWVKHIAMYEAMSIQFLRHLLDASAVQARDRVLDVGCGCGSTTLEVARAASQGAVLGVDLSSQQLALARQRAAEQGITNAQFEQADAQVYPFEPASFDLVISQFGVMFFEDPVAAFTNLRQGLRSGGRLVAMTWQVPPPGSWFMTVREAAAAEGDVPPIVLDVPSPLALADDARTTRILESAGFADVLHSPILDPVRLGADVDEALENLTDGIGAVGRTFVNLDADAYERALQRLKSELSERQTEAGVYFESAAWLLTARRA